MSEQPHLEREIAPEFMRQVARGTCGIRLIAIFCVFEGVFALTLMLLMAVQGLAVFDWAHLSFLVGGAVALAIGVGLMSYSAAARQAGSVWLLAWGLVNLLSGFVVVWRGDLPFGLLCAAGGAFLIVCAAILQQPASVFICDYIGGDISPSVVQEGVRQGLSDTAHPGLKAFVAVALLGALPLEKAETTDEEGKNDNA